MPARGDRAGVIARASRGLRWHLVALGIWVVWVSVHLFPRPLVVDEVEFAIQGLTPFGTWTLDAHPPLYIHTLWGLVHGVGASPQMLRGLGLVLLILTALTTYRVAERLRRGAGVWALWILLTNPLALQGAFLLDIDNTLLPWWTIVSVWWASRLAWPLPPRARVAMGLWWAFGLWMKFTTPLVLPMALWAVYAVRGEGRRGLIDVGQVSAIGATAFLAAWIWYSLVMHFSWTVIFLGRSFEMVRRGIGDPGVNVLTELLGRAVRIGWWIGPFGLLLWGAATIESCRRWRRLQHPEVWTVALLVGWSVLVGYWLIGGVIWSFAKYHCPLMPLLAALGGATVGRLTRDGRVPPWVFALIVGVVGLWQILLVGDPLYVVNRSLRHALLFHPDAMTALVTTLAIRYAGFCIVVVAAGCLLWISRRRFQMSRAAVAGLTLVLAAIGSGIGETLVQSAASYSTTYCYGRPWRTVYAIRAAALRLHAQQSEVRLMVPFDTIRLQLPVTEYQSVYVNEWTASLSRERFLRTLRDPRTGFVVMDPDFSSVRTIQTLWGDPEVRAVLDDAYVPLALETARGWVRRPYATGLHVAEGVS